MDEPQDRAGAAAGRAGRGAAGARTVQPLRRRGRRAGHDPRPGGAGGGRHDRGPGRAGDALRADGRGTRQHRAHGRHVGARHGGHARRGADAGPVGRDRRPGDDRSQQEHFGRVLRQEQHGCGNVQAAAHRPRGGRRRRQAGRGRAAAGGRCVEGDRQGQPGGWLHDLECARPVAGRAAAADPPAPRGCRRCARRPSGSPASPTTARSRRRGLPNRWAGSAFRPIARDGRS